jgi:type II secretory pathway pseudopilin PulG
MPTEPIPTVPRVRCKVLRGTSLLEVIFVLVILGAAAVAASYRLRPETLGIAKARSTGSQTAALLEAARQTSMAQGRAVQVAVVRSGSTQVVQANTQVGSGPFNVLLDQIIVDPSVAIVATPTTVRFIASGDANVSINWRVTSESHTYQVTVVPAGGITRMVKLP